MPYFDSHRRYDGPVPRWETESYRNPLVVRLLRFHRRRACDAAEQGLARLALAVSQNGSARVQNWMFAARLLTRYRAERDRHRLLWRMRCRPCKSPNWMTTLY